ncbi:MAG: flagellar biosynthesis protein FliQ [Planctomycetia bacterium]|nr:flagellar biosynthesis protein FliQ [Planctomycetia bacterium]
MDTGTLIEVGRGAIALTITLAFPVLLAAMAVGILMGIVQAVTQIQEQTLAFAPKALVVMLVLCLLLPWMLGTLVEFVQEIILSIPDSILTNM